MCMAMLRVGVCVLKPACVKELMCERLCVKEGCVCVNHLQRCKTSTSDFTWSLFILLLAREKMLNFYP